MSSVVIELLQKRLEFYKAASAVEEEHAVKEILQETALYALWRADFFDVAAFQGGTSLRILHRLQRFSEDLDFILKTPDTAFKWEKYLPKVFTALEEFGLRSKLLDRSRMDQNVRKAVLKDDSISNQLKLSFDSGGHARTISIKLEIDVHPPSGSSFEYRYLDFPLDFEVCHQDLPSNFALKIHALLCRPYLKGRDWYDFNWYVKERIRPNLLHLQSALRQYGPWARQGVEVDASWLSRVLTEKIAAIEWRAAAKDVERFLNSAERKSLSLWSEKFFRAKVEQLADSMRSP
jgi:predicted nucleotidyltransferase component of viral defense system